MTEPNRPFLPVLLFITLVLVGLLGAGAIALERPVGQAIGSVVTYAEGQPIDRARVTFSGPVTRTIETGPDGKFRFHNLPVGKYYVSARTKFYDPQWHDSEVAIAEGQIASGVAFRLSRTVPSVSVNNVQRVFTPGEPVRLFLRGTQIPAFDVTLYKLDLERALAASTQERDPLYRPSIAELKRLGAITPVKSWSQPIQERHVGEDGWFFQAFQMPELPAGTYLTSFSGVPEKLPSETKTPERMESTYWFNVSRLALVTKRAEGQFLAFAVDLESKKPVAGARVSLRHGARVLKRAVTDQQGLAKLDGAAPTGRLLLTGSHDGSFALASTYHYDHEAPYRLYAYTERPVYRPGQTVYFKGLVRAQKDARYQPAAGREVAVTVKDSTGTAILERRYTTNSASAFDGSLQLPDTAPLGEYSLELAVGRDASEQIAFKVADYRKPEFKVELTPAKRRYVMGETADIHMLASYYFGAPVPGAKLLVTVYSAPLYGQIDESESFFAGFTSEGEENYWGYGDVVHQQEGVTDAEGKFSLRVPLPAANSADDWTGNRTYTVAVEAMDAGGRPVKARESFRVTQGDIKLELSADQAVYGPSQPVRINATTEDYDGQPVDGTVTVKVVKLTYEDKKTEEGDEYTETKRTDAFTGTIETGADGHGSLTVPGLAEGNYEVVATAKDRGGRTIRETTWAWVAGEGMGGGGTSYDALRVVLDKKVYRPGDTARALVVAPVPGLSVLLTVEGTKLHSARVVTMTGTSALVELPVTEAFKPNAFVAACAVNGKEFMTTERSLNVLPEDKFLQVAITTDKDRYEPGETATYTVETRDHTGKPVAADVSLGVVDEAIYAIEPEHTPDIRGFFHGPRWNRVSTAHSFPEEYSGGLDKNAPDPRVRARFEDTAAWYPDLRTDASGKATVSFELPDNLTTWIATARAATGGTQVGSARHNVLATKDLLVRLETPRFLVEADKATLAVIAHNYTESEQEVAISLEVTGLSLARPEPQTVKLAPGEARRVAWEATATGVGPVTATATARSSTEGDAMKLEWPSLPYGLAGHVAGAGEATAESPASAVLALPAGAIPETVAMTVQLRTSPLPAILSAVDYLHRYEYGCVEQTMSRFLPDVAIPRHLPGAHPEVAERFSAMDDRIADGVRRLVSMQHGDGAWGWWVHDESNLEMTSYVLYGLAEARRASYSVPDASVNQAIGYLKRTLPRVKTDLYTRHSVQRDAGADARAFALFALAQWGQAPKAELDRLWADRARLTPFGQAQLALALAAAGDFRRFAAIDTLAGAVQETATQAHWASDARELAWQDNAIEATAYALRAYLAIVPNDPLVTKAARWLESRNVRGHWESTKDTGAAAIALAEYMAERRSEAPEGIGAVVRVNGEEVARLESLGAVPAPIELGSDRLKGGENVVTVEALGTGQLDFTANLAYVERAERLAPSPAPGLSVARDYFLLPAEVYARAQGKGTFANFYDDDLVKTLPRLGGSVKAGERVLVRLTVNADRSFRYMALEDPLPAGCEILEDQPPNWGYWWDHQEYRDEKAAFFFTHLGKGEKTLYYVMRPTTPGRYRVLPSAIWAMYTPEVRARGGAGELTITE